MIFCRDGIKIGLENKFYGKCFPAYHAAGGTFFCVNRLIPLAVNRLMELREKCIQKTEKVPSAQNSQSFFRGEKFSFEILFLGKW